MRILGKAAMLLPILSVALIVFELVHLVSCAYAVNLTYLLIHIDYSTCVFVTNTEFACDGLLPSVNQTAVPFFQ